MIMGQETYDQQKSDSPQTPFLEGLAGTQERRREGERRSESWERKKGRSTEKIEGKTEIAGR